ncbi:MAG: hypothetical protein ABIK64_03105 [Bacillota bacterium]
MGVLDQIAGARGRNDGQLHIELAEQLAGNGDAEGIADVVNGLGREQAVAGDCVKVLYEIGYRNPGLIAPYAETFLGLLQSKNNRLVWGAMIALSRIAELNPHPVYAQLNTVLAAYERGSVITVDNAVSVLAALCKADAAYEKRILPLLIRHLQSCRAREIPQHLERMSVCLQKSNIEPVVDILRTRMGELSKPQQARVGKALKKMKA